MFEGFYVLYSIGLTVLRVFSVWGRIRWRLKWNLLCDG